VVWPMKRGRGVDKTDGAATARGLGTGLMGGLLASLCCLPPALALVLGFGGSAFLVSLGAYQTEFRVAGFAVTGLVSWWVLRRHARSCGTRRSILPFLLLALGMFVGTYLVLTYVVVPFLYEVYAGR
jgi:hypothetical protein